MFIKLSQGAHKLGAGGRGATNSKLITDNIGIKQSALTSKNLSSIFPPERELKN
jgi:hypothetical protein